MATCASAFEPSRTTSRRFSGAARSGGDRDRHPPRTPDRDDRADISAAPKSAYALSETYPGQALAVALYVEGGVRGCEIGTVMFGRRPDGSEVPAAMDLVRLAIPRRTYTQSHVDYVIEVVRWVADHAEELRGYRILEPQPPQLRHFTARFRPLA
jgi:tryptophanase